MRYAARRDQNENDLVAAAEALGAVWVQAPPMDGWLHFRGVWHLCEVKDPKKQGWKSEYTEAQKLLLIRFSERGIKVNTLRTENDVFALLGARRCA